MARITSKKRQNKRTARTKKLRQLSERLVDDTSRPPSYPHTIESHRFMSSMAFDGNTLITKTQKDNEPVIERIYTKKQLAREIPIGKEMIDMYLDGEMPKELQTHHKGNSNGNGNGNGNRDNGVFRNVLISPADLGLLPPGTGGFEKREENTLHESQTRRLRRKSKKQHI